MVLIVGGARSGEYIKWFGTTVRIQREQYVLNRVHFTDGSTREYYVKVGMKLAGKLDEPTLVRVEVIG